MADGNNTAAYRTLKSSGFFMDKEPDAHFGSKMKNGQYVLRKPKKGRADWIFVGRGRGGAIECKVGSRTAWPFSRWEADQRQWAEKWEDQFGNPYWLFITLGSYVRHKQYPKTTILIPRKEILRLESDLDRKSIPYAMCHDELVEYKLTWAGSDTWAIPEDHSFWKVHGKPEIEHGSKFVSRYPAGQSPIHESAVSISVGAERGI